jgi:hypothetical protein
MKNIRILVLSVLVTIIMMLGNTVYAAVELYSTVSMQTSKTEFVKNEEVVVNVTLSDIQSENGIIAFGATLEYDKDSLTFVKMEGKGQWGNPTYNENNGKFIMDRNGGTTSNETILQITFKVKENSKANTTITLKDIAASDAIKLINKTSISKNITIKEETKQNTDSKTDNNQNQETNNNQNQGSDSNQNQSSDSNTNQGSNSSNQNQSSDSNKNQSSDNKNTNKNKVTNKNPDSSSNSDTNTDTENNENQDSNESQEEESNENQEQDLNENQNVENSDENKKTDTTEVENIISGRLPHTGTGDKIKMGLICGAIVVIIVCIRIFIKISRN